MRHAKFVHLILASSALIGVSQPAFAQVAAGNAPAASDSDGESNGIIVTARRREERLEDVPVSVTAVSGDTLASVQATNVRDVAKLAPGLNIDSDAPTRSFVSMRGVGTTLSDSVQPGVGIFMDGIFLPATSFFNSPLVDVERIEVLRGPQGTLFGNNTLGGAVNVVTKDPTDELTGRVDGTYAWADNFTSLSGSLSGAIVPDKIRFRVSGAYHQEDGFITNTLIGGDLNSSKQYSVRGRLDFLPSDNAKITLNGFYDYVKGGYFPYNQISGPTDYDYTSEQNLNSFGLDKYTGVNAKGVFDLEGINTQATLIGSYIHRDRHVLWDVDLGPTDFIRSDDYGKLDTYSVEARFETEWSDTISTLVGLFYTKYSDHAETNTLILPDTLAPGSADTSNRNRAVFANIFWNPSDKLEIAVGARYDEQSLTSTSAFTTAAYKVNELQPRASVTLHWTPDFMTYASVARGVRGGGQNPPGSPNLIYGNDSVWTYEVGTKFDAFGGDLFVTADVFYNDYSDYIGVNAIVPSTNSAAAIAVMLNTGDVESYGAEIEATWRVTPNWKLYGNVGLLHARTTDMSGFIAVTGFALPTDKILYTPDWTFFIGTNYEMPVGNGTLKFDANLSGKGSRPGFSYSQVGPVFLDPYYITNLSVKYDIGNFEFGVFANNLFDEKYYSTYFDISILGSALPPGLASNTGVTGARRRIGVTGSLHF